MNKTFSFANAPLSIQEWGGGTEHGITDVLNTNGDRDRSETIIQNTGTMGGTENRKQKTENRFFFDTDIHTQTHNSLLRGSWNSRPLDASY